ncbi:TPA: hypothetical protein LNF34_003457 [Vibrio cholerae]|nr:hypothetical protein [Vibrio cholerae]HBK7239836.1 hypothetical protein [Vibrio cholerae]
MVAVVVFEFSGSALPAPYAGVSFLKAKIIKIQTSCPEQSAFSVQIAQFGI